MQRLQASATIITKFWKYILYPYGTIIIKKFNNDMFKK